MTSSPLAGSEYTSLPTPSRLNRLHEFKPHYKWPKSIAQLRRVRECPRGLGTSCHPPRPNSPPATIERSVWRAITLQRDFPDNVFNTCDLVCLVTPPVPQFKYPKQTHQRCRSWIPGAATAVDPRDSGCIISLQLYRTVFRSGQKSPANTIAVQADIAIPNSSSKSISTALFWVHCRFAHVHVYLSSARRYCHQTASSGQYSPTAGRDASKTQCLVTGRGI